MPPPAALQPESRLPPDGPLAPVANGPIGPSTYITGSRANCCGPVGGDGPICSEFFVRIGASINLGGSSPMKDVVHSGWEVEGGWRSLFFNPDKTGAWTVELGVSNTLNQGKNPGQGIPLTILVPSATAGGAPSQIRFGTDVPAVTVRNLNRTFANLGGGREWYLFGAAGADCPTWRVGFDIGGRWGSASVEFHELRHRTEVNEGIWVALHTDAEIPCGCCTFFAGLRMEWDYTWSDILQTSSDLTGINVLANLGVRY
jgi:hypothetical protein